MCICNNREGVIKEKKNIDIYLVDAQGRFNSIHRLWEIPALLPRALSVFISANCLRDFGSVRPRGGAAEC